MHRDNHDTELHVDTRNRARNEVHIGDRRGHPRIVDGIFRECLVQFLIESPFSYKGVATASPVGREAVWADDDGVFPPPFPSAFDYFRTEPERNGVICPLRYAVITHTSRMGHVSSLSTTLLGIVVGRLVKS